MTGTVVECERCQRTYRPPSLWPDAKVCGRCHRDDIAADDAEHWAEACDPAMGDMTDPAQEAEAVAAVLPAFTMHDCIAAGSHFGGCDADCTAHLQAIDAAEAIVAEAEAEAIAAYIDANGGTAADFYAHLRAQPWLARAEKDNPMTDASNVVPLRTCNRCGADITGEHPNRKTCRDCSRPAADRRQEAIAAVVETVVAADGDATERLVMSTGEPHRYNPDRGYWHPITADRVTADITAAGVPPEDVKLHADAARAVAVAAVPPTTPATAAESAAAWHLSTGEKAPPGAVWRDAVVGIHRGSGPPELRTSPVDPLVFRRTPPTPWTWTGDPPAPDAIAATWSFLVGLTGSPELASALVADIGRMLAADWAETALVVMWGPSRTGKSTAVELIAGLMLGPDALTDDGTIAHAGYHAATSFADLGRQFGMGRLAEWRLIVLEDLARLQTRDADTDNGLAAIKSLSEGRPVRTEAKNRDPVTVAGDCGIVIASNHRPAFARSADDADAWAARMRIYRCARVLADADQRRNYGLDLVRSEGQAFARYAVAVYADQIARGTFTDAPAAMAAQRQLATDAGLPPLQVWARRYSPGGWTAWEDLTADASEHLGETPTARELGRAMRDVHGAEGVTNQSRKIDGLDRRGLSVTRK